MRTAWRLAVLPMSLAMSVAAAASVLALVAGTLPAVAHAELVSSTPAAGGTVKRLPDAVTLTFSELVRTPVFVEVTGPSGDIARGDVWVRDTDVTQPVERAAPGGRYAMSYRVTSADGHPISGTVRFTLTVPADDSDDSDDSDGSGNAQDSGAPLPTQPQPSGDGGLGTGQLVLLVLALVAGLGSLALGTRRALRHSVAMVEGGKAGSRRRGLFQRSGSDAP